MTVEFRERLPAEITESILYKRVIDQIKRGGEENQIDIEHVLWELGLLNEALNAWTEQNLMTTHLLSSNQLSEMVSIPGPQVHQSFVAFQAQVKQLQNKINERVYDFYSQVPEQNELDRSWLPLLNKVASGGFDRIDIVTTNYDLVIEVAIDALDSFKIRTGHRHGSVPGVDLSAWDSNSSEGLLTKLHGSVDWKLGGGGTEQAPVIRRGHPEFDGDHARRLIIYPGFKGSPNREPFIRFHEYFRRRLKDTSHMLFVGFAFRDDYINSLVSSELPTSAKVAVVDPTQTLPKLSFLRKAEHLKQGFGVLETDTLLAQAGLQPFNPKNLESWLR